MAVPTASEPEDARGPAAARRSASGPRAGPYERRTMLLRADVEARPAPMRGRPSLPRSSLNAVCQFPVRRALPAHRAAQTARAGSPLRVRIARRTKDRGAGSALLGAPALLRESRLRPKPLVAVRRHR